MRLVFMGTPDFAVAALKALADRHEIAAVYSQPPRPAGRGQKERPSPVHAYAAERGFTIETPPSLKPPEVQSAFAALKPDVAVVAAYGLILPRALLPVPKLGCLNIHASLLPRWRGAAPIQRAIMAGDAASGVTIMQMEAGLDTGPMLLKRETPIDDRTTAGDLHDALAVIGAELIVEALDRMAQDGLTPVPQPPEGVTHAPKIEKAEAHIDFNRATDALIRQIHGLAPFPGAWFQVGRERIKALRVERADGRGEPGTVLDKALTVATADGAIRIVELQRSGRAVVGAEAFLRGFALAAGTHLA